MRDLEIAMILWGVCAVSATIAAVTKGGYRGVPDAVVSVLTVCLMATGVALFLAEHIWLAGHLGDLGIGLVVAAVVLLVTLVFCRALRLPAADTRPPAASSTGDPYRTLQGRPWSARPPARPRASTSGWSYAADEPKEDRDV
jgi:hypothetical protein